MRSRNRAVARGERGGALWGFRGGDPRVSGVSRIPSGSRQTAVPVRPPRSADAGSRASVSGSDSCESYSVVMATKNKFGIK